MGNGGTARLLGRLGVAAAVVAALVVPVVLLSGGEPGPPPGAAPPRPSSSPPPVTTPPPSSPVCPTESTAAFARRFQNDGNPGLVEDAERPRLVDGPAFDFRVPGGGKRSEVKPLVPANREGQQVWVRDLSTFRGLPAGTDTWQVVLQWHHAEPSGSPPIALEVGGGRLRLANEGAHQQDLGPIGPDDTLDVVLRVVFSTDPARGTIDVWRDGRPVLTGYHPPGGTLLDEYDYLKVGLYRNPEIPQPSSMLLRRLDVGPTAASVGGTAPTCS